MKRNVCLLAFAAVLIALSGCISVPPIDREKGRYEGQDLPIPTSPQLKVGESVQVMIGGIPATEEKTFVDDIGQDGTITLPYLGKVEIAGMTEAEASDHIQREYIEKGIYKSAVVKVFAASRFVYVSGEIARPGRYPWSSDLTVSRMIEVAGDFGQFASHKVRLQRGNAAPVSVDVDAIRLGKMPDEPLYPGDRILIARSW